MRLPEWLSEAKQRYTERVEALEKVTQRLSAHELAAFVLFTPRQSYERAVKDWRLWRCGRYTKGSLWRSRLRNIGALPPGEALRRKRPETMQTWRERLQRQPGLGVIKAPFLMSLLEPTHPNVEVCLDVWMMRFLHGPHFEQGEHESYIEPAQRLAQGFARSFEMLPFAWQWATWDFVRSAAENRLPLLVRETRLDIDLAAG